MTRKQIEDMIDGIDERHISAAAQYDPPGIRQSPERIRTMKTYRTRKPFLIAAVVALALALCVTAYAAGWISPIFHRMQTMFAVPEDGAEVSEAFAEEVGKYKAEIEERNDLYAAAEQYMNDRQPEPETVTLPEFDNSRVTLSERYYDGEHLLLGVNLEEAVPEMAVGYTPDEAQMAEINSVAFFWDVRGNDDLDNLLEQGMDREIYEDYLENRSAYAKEYDLRNLSAIEFDWYLMRKLTSEAYEEAWKILRETGSLCVVDSSVSIGDHITLDDGTDLGPTGQFNLDSSASDAHSGNFFIEMNNLPEQAQNRDELNINLKLKDGRTWYYMELGGPAYFCYETACESFVSFTIENGSK